MPVILDACDWDGETVRYRLSNDTDSLVIAAFCRDDQCTEKGADVELGPGETITPNTSIDPKATRFWVFRDENKRLIGCLPLITHDSQDEPPDLLVSQATPCIPDLSGLAVEDTLVATGVATIYAEQAGRT